MNVYGHSLSTGLQPSPTLPQGEFDNNQEVYLYPIWGILRGYVFFGGGLQMSTPFCWTT